MGITVELPDWRLNYHVAAVGAWATILLESIYLILGSFENASLLSISILTNGSAILVAGFGDTSSTPLAVIRICLTTLFLLWAVILREDQTFDGTYAILCSVAHFVYQLRFQHDGLHSDKLLPQYEDGAKKDDAFLDSRLLTSPTDCDDQAIFSRSIRIYFGDSFCLESLMFPVSVLGTVMTYRVLDFDLGFGLVFAFMSAFLSSIILVFINFARLRGRKFDSPKIFQQLVGLILLSELAFFIMSFGLEESEPPFSWWKLSFGITWFLFLFKTAYFACRFLIHSTFIHANFTSCDACSQRESYIHGPLTEQTYKSCVWETYDALLAQPHNKDDTLCNPLSFRIRRQKCPDLVERFWLNDKEWFQISPRSFVIYFISCLAIASLSGGALNPEGSFATIGSHVSRVTAFYITMIFTFVSTGHTPAGDSPELMFVSLRHNVPDWRATIRATAVALCIHAYLVFPAFSALDLSFATPLACTIMAPLLLAGTSKRLDLTKIQIESGAGSEEKTAQGNPDDSASLSADWSINSTMVYSSSRIRGFDFRVLAFGISITLFDVLCNPFYDTMYIRIWPVSAVISISVTAIWLYLEIAIPKSRDVEPGILLMTTTSLVAIFSHVNFLDAFGLYDDERDDENSDHHMGIPEDARHWKPILIAIYYTTLFLMITVNRRLVQKNADQSLPAIDGQPPRKDHLLFSLHFHLKTPQINLLWQLRNSRVTICLVLIVLASFTGQNWPLKMNTTIASLLLFTLIVGFQLHPGPTDNQLNVNESESKSLPHIFALAFAAVMTIVGISLNRHFVFFDPSTVTDSKSDWKVGSACALISYQLFATISLRLKDRGLFTGPRNAEEQNEGKSTVQTGEKQEVASPTAAND